MEKHHYNNKSYYKEVVRQMLLEKEAENKIAEYIDSETAFIKKTWYVITAILVVLFNIIIFLT